MIAPLLGTLGAHVGLAALLSTAPTVPAAPATRATPASSRTITKYLEHYRTCEIREYERVLVSHCTKGDTLVTMITDGTRRVEYFDARGDGPSDGDVLRITKPHQQVLTRVGVEWTDASGVHYTREQVAQQTPFGALLLSHHDYTLLLDGAPRALTTPIVSRR